MYGDIGHGAVILFFGLYLFHWKKIYETQKKLDKERVLQLKNRAYQQELARDNMIELGNDSDNQIIANKDTNIKTNFKPNSQLEYMFKLRYLFV